MKDVFFLLTQKKASSAVISTPCGFVFCFSDSISKYKLEKKLNNTGASFPLMLCNQLFNHLVILQGVSIRVFSLKSCDVISTKSVTLKKIDEISAVDMDGRKRKLFIGTSKGLIKVFNYLSLEELKGVNHRHEIISLKGQMKEKLLLVLSADKKVSIYDDRQANKLVAIRVLLSCHTSNPICMDYLESEQRFSTSSEHSFRVWDFELLSVSCEIKVTEKQKIVMANFFSDNQFGLLYEDGEQVIFDLICRKKINARDNLVQVETLLRVNFSVLMDSFELTRFFKDIIFTSGCSYSILELSDYKIEEANQERSLANPYRKLEKMFDTKTTTCISRFNLAEIFVKNVIHLKSQKFTSSSHKTLVYGTGVGATLLFFEVNKSTQKYIKVLGFKYSTIQKLSKVLEINLDAKTRAGEKPRKSFSALEIDQAVESKISYDGLRGTPYHLKDGKVKGKQNISETEKEKSIYRVMRQLHGERTYDRTAKDIASELDLLRTQLSLIEEAERKFEHVTLVPGKSTKVQTYKLKKKNGRRRRKTSVVQDIQKERTKLLSLSVSETETKCSDVAMQQYKHFQRARKRDLF
eukprot:snap_masked-scaffold_6-processed-gene-19.32-mRNA-1 protein AED:1.00 eAED:1.00 QI:0/0/0/0/1/1/2/0/578